MIEHRPERPVPNPAWSGWSGAEIRRYGLDCHGAGRFEAAEAAYRHVLAAAPEDAETLHLLGALAYQRQRYGEAVEIIGRAIDLQGDRAPYHNNAALAWLALGQAEQAETSCRRAIALDPAYAAAHATLGTVLRVSGRPEAAAAACREALVLDPGSVVARCQLALACCDLGRLDAAVESFEAALRLAPDLPDALLGLAAALRALGRAEAAVGCYRRALRRQPDDPDIHNALGVTLRALSRPAEAEECYRMALRSAPGHAQAHNNLGTILCDQGRHVAALASFRAALDCCPDFAEAHSNLGAALVECGRPEEAEACHRRALGLAPDQPAAQYNFGNALLALGRKDEAEQCYLRAIALQPGYADAYFNLGTMQLELRHLQAAAANYEAALLQQPDHEPAHYNLGHLLLLTGRLEEGWGHYEWRAQMHGAGCRDFPVPRWDGAAFGDRVLLLHAEQGLGDTLQFCRYAPLVARLGRVVLEVQAPLVRLLSDLPGIARIVATGEALPPFDLHCPLMSLPLLLGTTLATIPGDVPYLAADPVRRDFWRRRLAALDGKRVGLVWAGGLRPEQPAAAAIDRRRSMALAQMAPLAAAEGVTFVSLQKGPPAAQAAAPPGGMVLHDFTAELTDFAETAALVAALDLVISVDTAVAHLAGALGKPVWLLNRFDSCWRWLLDRDDSPWYPSLRQFRQREPGDWPGVMAETTAALTGFLREGS